MNMRILKKLKLLLLIIPFFIALQSCQVTSQGPSHFIVESESIQLAWDPPTLEERDSAPIAYYKIYYTIHGQDDWILLDTITAEEKPNYTLYHSKFGNGVYDFAVSAVVASHYESDLHSSLDETARPNGGWYIVWARFEDEN